MGLKWVVCMSPSFPALVPVMILPSAGSRPHDCLSGRTMQWLRVPLKAAEPVGPEDPQSLGVCDDLLQLVDAENVQRQLLVEGFAGATPHLVEEVLLEGNLGAMHPFSG